MKPLRWPGLLLLLGLWSGAFVGSAAAATITARVDRDPVSVDESFHLIFEAEGEITGEPDFAKLRENFDILARSRSQNIGIENGRAVRSDSLRLTLLAREPGSFTIPAIRFGADRSTPVRITVRPRTPGSGLGGEPVLLEALVDTKTPYVQQQVMLTVRLLRTVDTSNASLSQPTTQGVETLIERLGDDRSYQAVRGAQRYYVVERKYALFPQHSGTLTVDALEFKGEMLVRRGSPLDVFDRSNTRFVRARSEPLSLSVREAPPGSDVPWLPARSLKLREQWPEQLEMRVGQPVTRTVEVEAEGLTAAQLPVLDRGLPDGFKRYPELPQLKNTATGRGMIGSRTETAALVPTQAGVFSLPAVRLSWWNTGQQRFEVASIPERRVTVLPEKRAPLRMGEEAPAASAGPGPGPAANADADSRTPIAVGGWQLLSLVLALGWSLTVMGWWRARARRAAQGDEEEDQRMTRRRALTAIKRACETGDAVAAKDALLAWGAVRWPESPPRGLGQLAARVDTALRDQLQALEAHLYGRRGEWDAAALWAAFKARSDRTSTKHDAAAAPTLEPLYPN